MAKFLTSLRVEEVSSEGRGTWQLLNLLAYKSDLLDYTLVAPSGFITDFASVPRIPVAFLLVGCMAHRAAVIHDWLYTSHEVDRATADKIFKEAALLDGAAEWRSLVFWAGVRIGGGNSWNSDSRRERQPEYVKHNFKENSDEA